MEQPSTQERFKRGAVDAGRYFQFMSEFIGFTAEDAAAIRETRFIIEKYIPAIVADFYTQVLRYPATRRHFLRSDGRVNLALVIATLPDVVLGAGAVVTAEQRTFSQLSPAEAKILANLPS